MKRGVITSNLIDLWAKPRFNSERLNQLLFGEVITVRKRDGDFYLVAQDDGYQGWVDRRFVNPNINPACLNCPSRQKAVVKTSTAQLFDESGQAGRAPHFLYYGTIVWLKKEHGKFLGICPPEGEMHYLKVNCVERAKESPVARSFGKLMAKEARKFLGVPYLWGGRTPAGFDCSGLVQAVCARFGRYIPRDTKDQIKEGVVVAREDVITGDLLFFKRHVAIALDRENFVHSSLGGGGVRINSLNPCDSEYREDLDRTFAQARRLQ